MSAFSYHSHFAYRISHIALPFTSSALASVSRSATLAWPSLAEPCLLCASSSGSERFGDDRDGEAVSGWIDRSFALLARFRFVRALVYKSCRIITLLLERGVLRVQYSAVQCSAVQYRERNKACVRCTYCSSDVENRKAQPKGNPIRVRVTLRCGEHRGPAVPDLPCRLSLVACRLSIFDFGSAPSGRSLVTFRFRGVRPRSSWSDV